jgi:hypothetical protein
MSSNLLNNLDNLYQQLPMVRCRQCGTCCVSPTCTLAEFVFLMDYCKRNISREVLETILITPARMHETCTGNLACKFLINNQCLAHDGRTGACRLFGIPALNELNVANMEECAHRIDVVSGACPVDFIQAWMDSIFMLNQTLFGCFNAPFFIKGLNLESWLDIYFDDTLDFDVFLDIRKVMHEHVNLDCIRNGFKPLTAIREKIDKISVFHSMMGAATAAELADLLFSIRDDYPLTGTYYFEEAQAYLFKIEQEGLKG